MLVSEVFGPTVQGEGPSTGRRAVFVRTATCNLSCAWCDTPYAVFYSQAKARRHNDGVAYDPRQEIQHRSTQDVASEVASRADNRPAVVVLTGGEPMIQQAELAEVLWWLGDLCPVEVETAGTLGIQHPQLYGPQVRFNVSPKLASSGNTLAERYKSDVLHQFVKLGPERAVFKFVATQASDLQEVEQFVETLDIGPGRVWIMPQGTTPGEVTSGLQTLAPQVLERGWQLSQRLHVQLWGDQRGT